MKKLNKNYVLTHFVESRKALLELLDEFHKVSPHHYFLMDKSNIIKFYKRNGALHNIEKIGEVRNEKWVYLIKK